MIGITITYFTIKDVWLRVGFDEVICAPFDGVQGI
jgi:hypothetical protein